MYSNSRIWEMRLKKKFACSITRFWEIDDTFHESIKNVAKLIQNHIQFSEVQSKLYNDTLPTAVKNIFLASTKTL